MIVVTICTLAALRENIGSNDGLARILRQFYEDRYMGTNGCSKYSTLTVDVNIFDRMMKVKFRNY